MALLETAFGWLANLIPTPYGAAVMLAVLVVGWGEFRLAPVRSQGAAQETAVAYMICKDRAIEEHGLTPAAARQFCLGFVPEGVLDRIQVQAEQLP